MSAGIENRISIYSVIGSVCGNLGIRNVNNVIDDMARWACEAELKIGTSGSYKRYECEIDVKNRKACLPTNFVHLIALKHGNEILDKTNKDFRMFDKAPKNAPANNHQGSTSTKTINKPGQALAMRVTFGGTFIAGETVVLTISHNDCGNVSSNTYTYVVEIGDTPQDIALAFFNQMNAIPNLAYTPLATDVNLDLTAKNNETTFNVTEYTNSILGTIKVCITQKHVKPTIVVNTTQNGGKQINTGSHNLANTSASELNTGNSRTDGFYGNGSFAGDYYGDSCSSKFSIENGYIYFNQIENGKVGIAYQGVWLDDKGFPMIKSSHEDAVAHYCMYMFKARKYYEGKLAHHVYKELQNRWQFLCGQARGDDELPDEAELRYLNNQWMQLLPLPHKNNF